MISGNAEATMTPVEEAVLRHELGEVTPQLAIQTRSRMDVGRWWLPARLWLVVLQDSLVVMAAGRRRYIEVVPFEEASESYYSHHAGELVIAPCETLQQSRLAIKSSEAIELLRLLGIEV
jgi:hypothetical protein